MTTNKRASTYSTHSIADAHLLAMLDEKESNYSQDVRGSRLSALLPSKLLQTVLIAPEPSAYSRKDERFEDDASSSSFDDRQKSIQVVGLPFPEKSKSSLKSSPEPEHIIDDTITDKPPYGIGYGSEPQMQYLEPGQKLAAYASGFRQQGCGYRHSRYYGPYYGGRGYGQYGGYSNPQRPPQAYFPGSRQHRSGYYYGGGGCVYGRGGDPAYNSYYVQRPVLVRRRGGCCYCC